MDDQPPAPLTIPSRERHDAEEHPQFPAGDAPPPHGSRRGVLWLLLLLLAIAGLVAWVVLRAGHQTAPTGRFQTSGPTPVGTAKVTTGDMPIVLSGLGTVTPLATVTVKTQINGQLTEVAFQEGQTVTKGDFLAQIDPRPYQVALEQAQGQLAKDQAALKNAEIDLARYRTLVAQNSIARQTADTQAALVEQDRGTVQADIAQVDTQKLNLTYCRITAPVGGRVGLRQVDAGNYVQTSDANGIVVITELQPISVIFTLPEDNLPADCLRAG
jgi:multidrug efflux system membrane fusion protein